MRCIRILPCSSGSQQKDEVILHRPWKIAASCDSWQGLPRGSMVKNPLPHAGDAGNVGLIPGLGRSPGEGNGNPRWYSCLGNSMDRGAWHATVQGGTMSQTRLKNKQQHGSLYVRLRGDYLPNGLPSFLDLNSKTRN